MCIRLVDAGEHAPAPLLDGRHDVVARRLLLRRAAPDEGGEAPGQPAHAHDEIEGGEHALASSDALEQLSRLSADLVALLGHLGESICNCNFQLIRDRVVVIIFRGLFSSDEYPNGVKLVKKTMGCVQRTMMCSILLFCLKKEMN